MIECTILLGIFLCISVFALAIQTYVIIKQKEKFIWLSPIILFLLFEITYVAFLSFKTMILPITILDLTLYPILKCGFTICMLMTMVETILMIISSICLKMTLKNNKNIIPENNQKIIEEIEKNI